MLTLSIMYFRHKTFKDIC